MTCHNVRGEGLESSAENNGYYLFSTNISDSAYAQH